MSIGIDLDGVIADLTPELLIRLKSIGVESNPEDWRSMYIEDVHPELPKGWASSQFADELFLMNAIAYESAFYCVNRWFFGGKDVFILTCRPESFRGVTERWLDEWGIAYNELFMGMPRLEKTSYLIDLGCDVFIEDHIGEAEKASDAGINTFLQLRPYNKHQKIKNKVRRVEDLYVVDAILENEKKSAR